MNLEEQVRNYYTSIEHYDWVTDAKYPEKLFHLIRAKTIAGVVNKYSASEILDVGCGTGLITRELKGHITAIDLNPWCLERAKLHTNHSATFVEGDAEDLPFPSENFSLVVCTEVLEHLIKINSAINGIYRVLKKDGLFVGSVPSRSIIWKWRKKITRTSPVAEPFHNNYTIEEFRPLLSNFRIIDIRYIAFGLSIMFVARKE